VFKKRQRLQSESSAQTSVSHIDPCSLSRCRAVASPGAAATLAAPGLLRVLGAAAAPAAAAALAPAAAAAAAPLPAPKRVHDHPSAAGRRRKLFQCGFIVWPRAAREAAADALGEGEGAGALQAGQLPQA
jgi:hypothetical protein